jgi:hypothetical protein
LSPRIFDWYDVKVTTFPVVVLLVHVFVVVTLADRADIFEMLAVFNDTVVAFSVAIFEMVWYDWNAFSVVIFALRTPRVLTFPV